jgi:hypothetical protein
MIHYRTTKPLPRVAKAAETLESGFPAVGLQPRTITTGNPGALRTVRGFETSPRTGLVT